MRILILTWSPSHMMPEYCRHMLEHQVALIQAACPEDSYVIEDRGPMTHRIGERLRSRGCEVTLIPTPPPGGMGVSVWRRSLLTRADQLLVLELDPAPQEWVRKMKVLARSIMPVRVIKAWRPLMDSPEELDPGG